MERDKLVSVQGALLLTYYVADTNPNTNSYWLGTAIHLARCLGADRYHITTEMPAKVTLKLKKIWWSCILRDRILALGLRRPLKIGSNDFDLTLSGMSEEDFEDELWKSSVYNPSTKKILAQLLCAQCELAAALTRLLEVLYPVKVTLHSQTTKSKYILKHCEEDLDRWYDRTSERFSLATRLAGAHNSLLLYISLPFIYYQ